MPGTVGVLCDDGAYASKEALLEVIDLLGTAQTEVADVEEGFLAAAYLPSAPLKGSRLHSCDAYTGTLAGDLVDFECVPWEFILGAIDSEDYSRFGELRGNFGIAVLDKARRKIVLVTDPRSQHPIYYRTTERGIVFSSVLTAFFRLTAVPRLSIEWLYEMIFFNFPMQRMTFLEGVYRLAPGSYNIYDLDTREMSSFRYVDPYVPAGDLRKGQEALDKAVSVFTSRVPKYFEGADGNIAVSLTSGWDSRTLLSLCPDDLMDSVVTYTYGIEGNEDLRRAREVANALRLNHLMIHFDDEFLRQLPQLMLETVYLSNGVEGILRAPVLYAYRIVTENGEVCPIIITGVSFDSMFKGYGNVPAMMSPGIDRVCRENAAVIDKEHYQQIFDTRYDDFAAHIHDNLDSLKEKYGEFGGSRFHLTYIVYDLIPNVFLGEMAIANQYSTFRVPCWDEDIVWLSYQIEFSRLRFSYYLGHPEPCAHNRLHTCLLMKNPAFAKLPVAGVPLKVWWMGKRALDLYRTLVWRPRRLLELERLTRVPIADWPSWMKREARPAMDDLIFSEDSLIREYIGARFLTRQEEERTPHWVGKLAKLEIILRQLSNGWRL
jgi:asparagine synthetase B (glutamine-hydrolysing)